MSLYSAIGYLSGLSLGVSADHDINSEHGGQKLFDVSFVKKGPLGIKLALKRKRDSPQSSKIVVIDLPRDAETGAKGQVEASGKVTIGDELLMVNDQPLPKDDFSGTVSLLQSSSWPLVLKFRRLAAKPTLTETEIERLLADTSPSADQRRIRMVDAIKASAGGPLLLKTIEFRSSIRSQNQAVIKQSQEIEPPLKKVSDAINARAKGSTALVVELNRAPQLKAQIKDISKQVGSISSSIGRIEALLSEREARRAASNPFTFINTESARNRSEVIGPASSLSRSSHHPPSSPSSSFTSPQSSPSTDKRDLLNTPDSQQAADSTSSSPISSTSSSLSPDSSSLSSSSSSSPEFDMSDMSPVDAINLSLQVVDDLLDRRSSRSASMLEGEEERIHHENKGVHDDTYENSGREMDQSGDNVETLQETEATKETSLPIVEKNDGVNDALRALLGDDFKTVTNQES